MPRHVAVLFVVLFSCVSTLGICKGSDISDFRKQPLGEVPPFQKPDDDALVEASSHLRKALEPLDELLSESQSGADWRAYLDWSSLEAQATAGHNLDVSVLLKLYRRFNASENGLEMYQFVTVRRALAAAIEVAVAATNDQAAETYTKRIQKLGDLVRKAAKDKTPKSLDGVGPLLARLVESRQASGLVARIRSAVDRPNLYMSVNESLLSSAVNRVVDRTSPVNEVVLGTPVRGTGHTSGLVLLDFLPSSQRAVTQLSFQATNLANTRSTKGPVTVCSEGVTELSAQKRIYIDDERVWADPTVASASTKTRMTGIGIKSRFGKNFIRRVASKKVSQMKPKIEAISERRAQERVRQEFEAETAEAIGQASQDYEHKFRRPLKARGWYPELLRMSTTNEKLTVVGRKALRDQIAAFTDPPKVDDDAILSVRVHETLVNNASEITLAGRTITQEFVEEQLKERDGELPESLTSDPDQPPWSITFAKKRPVEINSNDGSFRLTIRGSRYTSGDRSFPAMDIWVAYKIDAASENIRLVRDGDVQIYPPGFVPGGDKKLSVSETSLRRILQKRFGKVFKEVVDIESLELPDQLAAAGPLPMEQLEARKDGWMAIGWRKKDEKSTGSKDSVAGLEVPNQLGSHLWMHDFLLVGE
ncbi:MAG: hypothetical protein ACR2NI_03220 [Pirellulales bacterium]